MDDRIGYQTKFASWVCEYRLLQEWREVPGAFLLYFDREHFHLIPKAGFSLSQVAQFRNLISGHQRDPAL